MKKNIFGMAWMAAALVALSSGCSHKSGVATESGADSMGAVPVSVGSQSYIPRATVFKMSGPYADHVAVTIGNDGRLTYFPAPSDINRNTLPVYLGHGWWLNRQGLGPNSVFTSWTMEEYARLAETPSEAQIRAHIIPGAGVIDFRNTSVLLPDAMKNLAKIRSELPR